MSTPAPATDSPAPPTPILLSHTWDGDATHGYPTGPGARVPDCYLFPELAAGRLYYLQSATLVSKSPVAIDWAQASFCYNKVLNQGVPQADTPNLDSVDDGKIPESLVGSVEAGGGPQPAPPSGSPITPSHWIPWTQPLPFSPSIQVQYGGSLAVGSSAEISLVFQKGPAGTEQRLTEGVKGVTSFAPKFPAVPAGKRWIVCDAFIQGSVPYSGQITTKDNDTVLASHAEALGASQSTGGYSTKQCGSALGGSDTVWPDYLKLEAGDQVLPVGTSDDAGDFGCLVMAFEVDAD